MSNSSVLVEDVVNILGKYLSTEDKLQVIQTIGVTTSEKRATLATRVMKAVHFRIHNKETVDKIQNDIDNLVRGGYA